MWQCGECGRIFDEPIQYNPDNVDCIGWEDFDLWCDFENEPCCPHCYSVQITECEEQDDDDSAES